MDAEKRFAEEQIIGFLREAEVGLAVAELSLRPGLSETSYLPQEHKFVGTNVSDAKHLNGLKKENARLKRLLAEAMLENEVSNEALRKSGDCTSHTRTGVPHGQSRLERAPLVSRHWYER